jgi:hypothetical protein
MRERLRPRSEITQRDLRNRSREIVPRREFAAGSRSAPGMDIETFRADPEAAFDSDLTSPYDR